MKDISADRFDEIAAGMQQARIAVLGDIMVDRYIRGSVTRTSPEAPVPIVSLEDESANLGGAANVAANVGTLGADVYLFGLVGDDSASEILRDLLKSQGYSDDGVLADASRQTIIKTRVIAQNQHLLRIDRETIVYPDESVALRLLGKLGTQLNQVDAVILEDYNKGMLSPFIIAKVIDACRSNGVPVGVDPKFDNFWEYKGATLFKPNVRELELATATQIQSDGELEDAGFQVLERIEADYVLVTAGSKGMSLFSEKGVSHVPTQAHRVHDVSGAGDTVIATIVTAMAGGATIEEAATLATYAAGVVIAEVGAVPINTDKLRRVCVGRA